MFNMFKNWAFKREYKASYKLTKGTAPLQSSKTSTLVSRKASSQFCLRHLLYSISAVLISDNLKYTKLGDNLFGGGGALHILVLSFCK